MMMGADVRLPLSPAQFGLWWQERRGGAPHTVTEAVDFHGILVVPALVAALRTVHERHPALRTAVVVDGGLPFLEPGVGGQLDVELVDAGGGREDGEGMAPVVLATGDAQRVRIARFGPHWHRLIVKTHHLVTDAHSWRRILLPQIAAAYADELSVGVAVPPPQRTIADYAEWRAVLESSDDYVRRCEALAGAVSVVEETRRPAGRDVTSESAESRSFVIAANAAAWIRRCRVEAGVSPLAVFMAASSIAAAAALGIVAPLISCRVSDRPGQDFDEVCGMFVNAVPYRLPVSVETVGELIYSAGEAATTLLVSRHVAFADVERRQAVLTGRRTLAVDTMMTYTPHDEVAPRFVGVHAAPIERVPDMSFPLEISFYVVEGALQATVYASSSIGRAGVEIAAARAKEFCAFAFEPCRSLPVGEVLS